MTRAIARPRIEPGTVVTHKGREYRIKERLDVETVTALDAETGKTKALPTAELNFGAPPTTDTRRHALDGLTEEQRGTAQERVDAIRPLLDQGSYSADDVAARAAEVGRSARTLYRWIRFYTASGGDHTSLVPRKRGWTEGNTRITANAEDVVNEVIETYYLTPMRPSGKKVIEEVQRLCAKQRIVPPSPLTIRRRLALVPQGTRLAKRGEPARARTQYEPAAKHFPGAEYPLAVVQIDHTQADVVLVDDKAREPIGRPWLTVALDLYSRMITGYYLSLEAPSVLSVAMCITHAILPKEKSLLGRGLPDTKWPVWGFPDTVHLDNGSDFRSTDFQASCEKHGIHIEYRPLGRTDFGGGVERVIRSIMENLRGVPGYTASSVAERGEQDPASHAAMTLGELERWLIIWICKQYHHQTHSTIETTPLARWEHGLLGTESDPGPGPQARPAAPDDLVRDFLPSEQRTVQKTGVTIAKLRYYAECLRPWIGKRNPVNGPKFTFRRDPRDISQIWFYDPKAKRYFKIPLADQSIPPMSLREYERARKKLKLRGTSKANTAQIVRAVDERRRLEEDAQSATLQAKQARRDRQRRKNDAAAPEPTRPSPSASRAPERQPASDLSYEPLGRLEIIE